MAEKFDEFSKHLASRRSRRGVLKLLGGGFLGAVVSTLSFRRGAEADHLPYFNSQYKPQFNQTFWYWPRFNQTVPPYFNQTNPKPPQFNQTDPEPPKFNQTGPRFKRRQKYYTEWDPKLDESDWR